MFGGFSLKESEECGYTFNKFSIIHFFLFSINIIAYEYKRASNLKMILYIHTYILHTTYIYYIITDICTERGIVRERACMGVCVCVVSRLISIP